jgi:NACalpha-BTF3-like transcription factor
MSYGGGNRLPEEPTDEPSYRELVRQQVELAALRRDIDARRLREVPLDDPPGQEELSDSESESESESEAEQQETRPPSRNVELVAEQAGLTREEAAAVLVRNDGDIINAVMEATEHDRTIADAQDAVERAEEALTRSSIAHEDVPRTTDWAPLPRDWARLALTSSEYGSAGHASASQLQRDAMLSNHFAEMEREALGNVHDAVNSGILRDLVYPTLEWRMAWAHQRGWPSQFTWRLRFQWYRAIAILKARYPSHIRREDPYRGQRRTVRDESDEVLWLEYLLDKVDSFDAPEGAVAQARRTAEVKRLLCAPRGTNTRSAPRTRNLVRALVRDTMANLAPRAWAWPDPIWAHALSCVKRWDEEMLTMPTSQWRAVQLMDGLEDAEIEAQARILEVANGPHTTSELLDADFALHRARAVRERAEAQTDGNVRVRHVWARVEEELAEQAAVAETAELAMVRRTAAETAAASAAAGARMYNSNWEPQLLPHRMLEVNSFIDSFVDTPSRRSSQAFATARSTLVRHADGTESYTTVVVDAPTRPVTVSQRNRKQELTAEREAIEDQMERGEITEGAYLERMNSLRDRYNRMPDDDYLQWLEALRDPPVLPHREFRIVATDNGPPGLYPHDERARSSALADRSPRFERAWEMFVRPEEVD